MRWFLLFQVCYLVGRFEVGLAFLLTLPRLNNRQHTIIEFIIVRMSPERIAITTFKTIVARAQAACSLEDPHQLSPRDENTSFTDIQVG